MILQSALALSTAQSISTADSTTAATEMQPATEQPVNADSAALADHQPGPSGTNPEDYSAILGGGKKFRNFDFSRFRKKTFKWLLSKSFYSYTLICILETCYKNFLEPKQICHIVKLLLLLANLWHSLLY